MITKYKIFESTDKIISEIDKKLKTFSDNNSYAFVVDYDNRVFFEKAVDHGELKYNVCYYEYNLDDDEMFDESMYFKISGRIWEKEKLITFWDLDYEIIDDEINLKLIKNIISEFNFYYSKNLKINNLNIELSVDNNTYNELKDKYYSYCFNNGYCFLHIPVIEFFELIEQGLDIKPDEELKILHLLNSKEKSKELKKQGYEPKIKRWKEWQKPFENADFVYLKNHKQLSHYDNDAFAFTYFPDYDKLLIGQAGESHGKIYLNQEIPETGKYYTGRIWIKSKIISFWEYPDKKTFNKIIRELEDKLDINLDNYLVDVKIDDIDTILIPIKNYKGNQYYDEDAHNLHLMNSEEKTKELFKRGYKPKIKHWKEWQKPFENVKFDNIDNVL